MTHIKPDWDHYFMQLADVVKLRGNCIRPPLVGAVVVRDSRIIATGYTGTPHGIANCDEGGCDRCQARAEGKIGSGEAKDSCVCIHAELNTIIQAALHGVSTRGATLYTTYAPCTTCAKMIVNAHIVRVVYDVPHEKDTGGIDLLRRAGVEVVHLAD
jgi:dCMP deaminase